MYRLPPPPPPTQGQSDVSFRGLGTLFSKYEQTNAVNMLGGNPSGLIEGLALGPAKICIGIICKVVLLQQASDFKYLRTASKRSPFSVPSVLGHGAFCCIKSASQTLIVFF